MSDGKIKVAGCDCGKDSLHVSILDEVPQNLKNFVRSYKPLVVKATLEDIQKLLELPVDVFVLEPTGVYSDIWIENFKRAGKKYKLVNPRRVRHYLEYKGVSNKADKPDAAGIAAYSLENLENEQAFLKIERLQVRELYLQLDSVGRSKNSDQNRLGQRLSVEFPEAVTPYENSYRSWLEENPPAIYRFLAGEDLKGPYSKKREESYKNTIGIGLKAPTRSLARHLCEYEKMEYELEKLLEQELLKEEFSAYHRVFDRFEVPQKIRAAILSRIYPFEDFLRDGRPFKEYIRGAESQRKSGMTKRDRSEGEFKLSLGMGKILHQSGNKTEWKASGAKYARTALWRYVKAVIVIRRSSKGASKEEGKFLNIVSKAQEALGKKGGRTPWLDTDLVEAVATITGSTLEIASLRLHFEFQIDKKGDRRTSSTAGRFCRMLYKALLSEFVVKS